MAMAVELSKTQIKKTTGNDSYATHSVSTKSKSRNTRESSKQQHQRQCKTIVNQWVAELSSEHMVMDSDLPWAFLLETRNLFTIKALLASNCNFASARTVIPNPNKSELEAMLLLEPELHTFATTSHVLLKDLAKQEHIGDKQEHTNTQSHAPVNKHTFDATTNNPVHISVAKHDISVAKHDGDHDHDGLTSGKSPNQNGHVVDKKYPEHPQPQPQSQTQTQPQPQPQTTQPQTQTQTQPQPLPQSQPQPQPQPQPQLQPRPQPQPQPQLQPQPQPQPQPQLQQQPQPQPQLQLQPQPQPHLQPQLQPQTKHSNELTPNLSLTASSAHDHLRMREWPGWFQLVWLDYCGNLASRAGRGRQLDLELLFAGKLVRATSIVFITTSERGASPLYTHEVVDNCVVMMMMLAEAHGMHVECIGVGDPCLVFVGGGVVIVVVLLHHHCLLRFLLLLPHHHRHHHCYLLLPPRLVLVLLIVIVLVLLVLGSWSSYCYCSRSSASCS